MSRARAARSAAGRALERLLAPLLVPVAVVAAAAAWLASRATMPGVIVETRSSPAPSAGDLAPHATFFAVGLAERGSVVDPILVSSLTEFRARLGDRQTYGALWDAAETFFLEGGTRAYFARVTGAAATVGTRNLSDRAGAPVQTLRIDASSPGAWSADVEVEIRDGQIANTYTIVVYYKGAQVETFPNLASPADGVTALSRSLYVRGADLASVSAAPLNNPAVAARAALSAGTDDRAAVTTADYTAALARFGIALGAGMVAIPGQPASAVGTALRDHARANNRLAAVAGPAGQTIAAARTDAGTLTGTTGSEHVGYFYPWLRVPNGSGGTRLVSPEAFVAAVRARAHVEVGPWEAPAGERGVARHVVGLETALTDLEGNEANEAGVSVIRTVQGRIRLYGWRSLSADLLNYRLLKNRDVLNAIAAEASEALERFVFRTIDGRGHLFAELDAELRGIVQPYSDGGGLYPREDRSTGTQIDPGYTVAADATVNTPDVVGRDELRAEVRCRVAPSAELVRLLITKVATTAAL